MDGSRRTFLKLAGLSALGAAGVASVKVAAQGHGTTAQAPATGKRLAMVIDLRKLKKNDPLLAKCIKACHNAHNVPDFGDDHKNEVKWIWTEDFETAFHSEEFLFIREDLEGKSVLLLCNHCANPPCTRVCPTQATWKREADGVVMMDWHRCIGCRYCIVACPYGSRSFNWKNPRRAENLADPATSFPTRMRGVVEKCNFCEERLAVGQPPACVAACDNQEIVFGDLNDPQSEVRAVLTKHLAIRRKPGLGTQPEVYYIVDDPTSLESAAPLSLDEEIAKEADHA
jgi:Fe-S-cluster-containing dehydrogenase component